MTENPDSLTHLCPPKGGGICPCCGKTPFELPDTDRITIDRDAVTCSTREHGVTL